MRITEPLARAMAQDAGNRSMRAAGRAAWAIEDWNVAAAEYDRIWPLEGGVR